LYYHFDNKEALGNAVEDEIIASNLHRKWRVQQPAAIAAS
jgi:AcrR family transcriptional regulator